MQHAGRNNCIEIHSKDNKTVKLAASLAEKKHRDALGAYLIEGPNLVREALQQGVRIQFIFTGAGALNQQQEIQDILSLAEDSDSAVCVLSEDCFAKIATSQTPQPIMAVAEKRTWQMRDVFSPGGNVLVLDRIQDPGNLGTLLRTAEATGFAGALIVKGGADPYGPKAVRAGAGCVFRFPLLLCESPAEALDRTGPKCGYRHRKRGERCRRLIQRKQWTGHRAHGRADRVLERRHRRGDPDVRIPAPESGAERTGKYSNTLAMEANLHERKTHTTDAGSRKEDGKHLFSAGSRRTPH